MTQLDLHHEVRTLRLQLDHQKRLFDAVVGRLALVLPTSFGALMVAIEDSSDDAIAAMKTSAGIEIVDPASMVRRQQRIAAEKMLAAIEEGHPPVARGTSVIVDRSVHERLRATAAAAREAGLIPARAKAE